jgi:hypothetical protein
MQLDGGTQFMMFILTLTVQGGAGFKVTMPTSVGPFPPLIFFLL